VNKEVEILMESKVLCNVVVKPGWIKPLFLESSQFLSTFMENRPTAKSKIVLST